MSRSYVDTVKSALLTDVATRRKTLNIRIKLEERNLIDRAAGRR